MHKVTPNPPEPETDPKKLQEASDRALDYYLNPKQAKSENKPSPGQLFTIVDGIDTESLLANLSETLASADAMVSDLAFDLKGSRRHVALGILQLIELSGLLANRLLDNVNPQH
ncbi:hypothetical protein SAMN03159488_02619 [Pseudomonas sp. NFIX10]|uniref:DUF6124 family protein n=1 Tax=Pseudomonas TaxID=286 RepID=UPI00087185C4|nr:MULTISPECIES: DUF6124 family protein [unclassified Pseudomonas]SCW81724.1 hypothetical protein SAMN03159481_02685 [Pseudomonas sp. NFACC56-3]SFB25300.1 hypothetical protein SAMN03159488_02619 [Pseudomonas sp. NFIX10]SFE92623.1 hypothetical protein SAMN03159367_02476 [Pseudomonas sp. NFACC06-1]SFK48895.1 hypothetical protein SAMN03159473_02264 [Pseudomonas sp. NFACC52]